MILMRSLVVAVTLAVAAVAHAAPSPLPTPIGFVSDFAGVIDAETEGLILARLIELRRLTGAEIAVVTVRSTAPDPVFDYAMRLAETWKPGTAGKDNGVVFVVSVDDREMFIATGYGVEGALPDGLVGEIRDRDILPRFRAGDVAGGIRAGVERMALRIAEDAGVSLGPQRVAPNAPGRRPSQFQLGPMAILLLLFIFFVVLPALSRAASSGGRRARRRGMWGPPMWGGGFGGGGFGGHGGGFGGFGGGSFGGGGAGGKW